MTNPTMSKVKIGTVVYDLKDADARQSLSTLLGTAAGSTLGSAAFLDTVTSGSSIASGGTNIPTAGAVYDAISTAVTGLTGGMRFVGKITGADFATAIATVSSPTSGDIVIWDTHEYVYDGTTWQELGDESIYATAATVAADYVANTRQICGKPLSADITVADMKTALGLGALAYKDSASGTVASQTITGVKATGTSTGSIDVALSQSSTSATLTKGNFTPAGTNAASAVTVNTSNDTFVKSLKAGTTDAAAFTEGAFTPAAIQTGFYTAGSDASLSAGTQASLTAQTTAKFVKKAYSIAMDATDSEQLNITDVADTDTTFFTDAVTDRGTFTANTLQTLTGGVATVIDTTKFSGGSKAADTFSAQKLPVVDGTADALTGITSAEAAAQVFTGTEASDVLVTDVKYNQASVDTTNTKFNGASIELSVGDITVGSQNVSVS